MKSPSMIVVLPILVFAMLSPMAEAHNFGAHQAGFSEGFLHPFGGIDHLLAMLAVGVWASQLSGLAIMLVPACFIGVMLISALLGAGGMTLPFLEPVIASSVLLLGLLIAFAVRLPLIPSLAIVGFFAIFHGYAHGLELPQAASARLYGAGFVLATGLLHAAGVLFGTMTRRTLLNARLSGSMIAAAGVVLLVSA